MPFRPLPCKTVQNVLRSFGFEKQPLAGTSHEKWVCMRDGIRRVVTVDCHRGQVRDMDVKSIIGQAGLTSKEFWRAVERN